MPWADLTDARLYYELFGSGEPLLLIPGLGATCRTWDPILPGLSERFSVVCVDNRGAGRSSSKRSPHTVSDFSSDLLELLDTLQLDRCHVAGLSMGGVVAQRLAVDHPSRVSRLVLISCTHQFGPYLRQVANLLGQTLRRFPYRMYLQTMEVLGTAPAISTAPPKTSNAQVDARCRDHAGRAGGGAAALRGGVAVRPGGLRDRLPHAGAGGRVRPADPQLLGQADGGRDPRQPVCRAQGGRTQPRRREARSHAGGGRGVPRRRTKRCEFCIPPREGWLRGRIQTQGR